MMRLVTKLIQKMGRVCMIGRSIVKRASAKSLLYFAASLLSWYLGQTIAMRWFVVYGVGVFCQEICLALEKTEAAFRIVAAVYATSALVYVLIEASLRNYFWAFAGLAAHSFLVWTMLVSKSSQ